ncbi:MAG: transglycosylase domain-containing protein, partial [Myxococcota bacterium]
MRGYRTARPTIALTNRRRGGTAVTVLRGLLVFLLWLPLPISIIATVALSTYMERVPPTPNLELMRHTPATTIVTTDRTRVGGLIRGREPYADHTDIPARVKFAFLAAEDDAFFEHSGFDMIAIARAFLRNQAAGRIVEGGSTLTQQLAKTIVSNEESYHRKIIEVFLARRIEARYTKSDILEVYLNHIYLGAGAYGVVAAAKIYFDKTLPELTWDEAALIAGITQSPTALNPFRHPERTLGRRRLILNRLVLLGVMSPDEANAAIARPLSLRTDWNGDEDTAPYAAVEARERLKQWYGNEVMESGGYRATLSLSPALQGHARYAVARGLRALDRRQGYRGPLAHIAHGHWDTFEHRVATIYGTQEDNWSPVPMRPYVGLVREVSPEQMRVS